MAGGCLNFKHAAIFRRNQKATGHEHPWPKIQEKESLSFKWQACPCDLILNKHRCEVYKQKARSFFRNWTNLASLPAAEMSVKENLEPAQ
jgi:hypothetical protein